MQYFNDARNLGPLSSSELDPRVASESRRFAEPDTISLDTWRIDNLWGGNYSNAGTAQLRGCNEVGRLLAPEPIHSPASVRGRPFHISDQADEAFMHSRFYSSNDDEVEEPSSGDIQACFFDFDIPHSPKACPAALAACPPQALFL